MLAGTPCQCSRMGTIPADVLFNAADRQPFPRPSVKEFERLLITAILFEPHLIMPDVLFFNSKIILEHLNNRPGKRSLLELALAEKILIPAVRADTLDSYSSIAKLLRKQGILGLLSEVDLEFVSARLDSASGGIVPDKIWPDRMAESYAQLLKNVLQRDLPPEVGNTRIDQGTWSRTQDLRYEALDDAISRESNYGVRRGEAIISAATSRNILPKDSTHLPEEQQLLSAFRNPRDRADFTAYLRWLDALYARNQAEKLSLRLSTSTTDTNSLAMMSVPLADASAMETFGSSMTREWKLDHLKVRAPNLNTLVESSPETILEMRLLGLEWRLALEAFFREPTPERRNSIELAAEKFGKLARRSMRRVTLGHFEFGGAIGAGATGVLVTSVGELADPAVGVLLSASSFGFATVRYLARTRTQLIHNPLRTLSPTTS